MAYQPKSYKKFVATAATATLVATAVAPTALAADFTDVSSNYKVAVDYLVDQGIAQGLTETTFGVTSPIKRGDAAVMIANALGLDTENAPDAGFTDLNARVAGAVNALFAEEIISGKTETTFAPDLYITRQEMAKVLANAYGLTGESVDNEFTDVNSNWDEYVDALLAAGITQGYNETTFGAADDVTRGQFALFIYRAEGQAPVVPAVASLEFNEEGTQFTIEFAQGLPEGANLAYVLENYAITINGAAITPEQVEALALELASVSDNRMVIDVSHTDLDSLAEALGGDSVTLTIGGKAATYTFDGEVADEEAPTFAYDGETELTVGFGEDFTLPEVTATDNVDETVTVDSVITNADGEEVDMIDTELPGVYTVTYTATDAAGNSSELVFTVTVSEEVVAPTPAVESVMATNLKQVEVKFNKAVDETTAETLSNYSFSGLTTGSDAAIAGGSAELQADGMTVVLTLGVAADQQDTATLNVKNVKDTTGATITNFAGTVNFFDATPPTVEDVRVVGPRQVEVSFSEPLNPAAGNPVITLDNGSVSTSVQLTSNGEKALVTFGVAPTEGLHTLTISGGKDYADFGIVRTVETFNYVVDTTAPTASVDKATSDVVTLKFSKPVSVKNTAGVTVYHTVNNNSAYRGTLSAAGTVVNGFTDTFTVSFGTPLPEGTSNVYLNTSANSFEDAWGNDVASTILSATVVLDRVAPTVSSVISERENEFVVKFSEAVVEAQAEAVASYILTDSDGDRVTLSAPTYDADTMEATFGTDLEPGTYTLTVRNIDDLAGNRISTQTVTFVVPDTTPWGLTSAVANDDNNRLQVRFNEAMSADGLTTLSNYGLYKLVGEELVREPFPTGTSIVALSNNAVEIRLGTADANLENYVLRVAGTLKDAAGNGYTATQFQQIEIDGDALTTDSIDLDTAKTRTTRSLSFVVEQELSGSVSSSDFDLFDAEGGTQLDVGQVTYVNNNGKSTVTVTLDANETAFASDATPYLVIEEGGLTNTFGTPSDLIAFEVEDGLAPSVAVYDDGENEGELIIEDISTSVVADFSIEFNEELFDASALAASDLIITDQNGDRLVAGEDYNVDEDGNLLVVELTDTEFAGTLTVSSIANPAYIRDIEGNRANAFAATTVSVTNSVFITLQDQLEDLVNTANDTTLATVSEDGNDVVEGEMWVTQAEQTAFTTAIDTAEQALEDADTTQEVQDAIEALEAAIAAYEDAQQAAVVSREDLAAEITTAEAADDTVTVSAAGDGSDLDPGTPYVTQAQQTALETAITTAQTAFTDADTQDEVDAAEEALALAISTYNAAIEIAGI